MKKKMAPIEKLAREICWAGFTSPGAKIGKTKASYWKSITENSRKNYIADAHRFAFLLARVSVDVLNEVHSR
jgi:hypothetical protein